MNVILLDNVENLGTIGDLVKVKPGYGRNYLIPHGKAALATPENIKAIEARRAELEIFISPETETHLADIIPQITPPDQAIPPKVTADPSLKNGEARMTWENGFMQYSLDRVCDEILQALRHASEQMKLQTQKV